MSTTFIDITGFCRLCLQHKTDSIDLFPNDSQYEEPTLRDKIMECISLEISPTYEGPRKICNRCLSNINGWFRFKQECIMANDNLQRIMKQLNDQDKSSSISKLNKIIEDKSTMIKGNCFSDLSLLDFGLLSDRNINCGTNFELFFQLSSDIVEKAIDCNKSDDFLQSITNPLGLCATIDQSSLSSSVASEFLETNNVQELNGNISNTSEHCEEPMSLTTYQCDLCDLTFPRFNDLLKHDDTVHDTVPRSYSCDTCQRLFISEKQLKSHYSSHREKAFQCFTCKKVFSSKKSLQVHTRLHTGKYKCGACSYVSTSKMYLEEHIRKHENPNKLYVCKICSLSLSRKSSLIRHEKIHLKHRGKLYKCPNCMVVARTHSELKDHINSHSSVVSPFRCELCNKLYSSKKTLEMHKQRHEAGTFVCSTCKKRMFSKYELRLHEDTHTDSKPFECFHCDKKFSFKSTLIKHVRNFYPFVRSDVNVNELP